MWKRGKRQNGFLVINWLKRKESNFEYCFETVGLFLVRLLLESECLECESLRGARVKLDGDLI